jgi:hypothetical protein
LRSAERSEGNPLNEACFSIWEKKKAQQSAKRNAGAFLLTLGGLRSAEPSEGNPLNEACFSIWEKKKAQQSAKRNAGAFLLTLGGLRSAERSEGNPRLKLPVKTGLDFYALFDQFVLKLVRSFDKSGYNQCGSRAQVHEKVRVGFAYLLELGDIQRALA